MSEASNVPWSGNRAELEAHAIEQLSALRTTVLEQMHKVIVGHTSILEHLLVALLVEGHVLLEGVPGVAKTLMVRTLAHVLRMDYNRIQFTPDVMPSDILGTQVFDLQQQRFHLVQGPIFTQLCLADEINRAPAKTQSALLQAMEERQVSIDGTHHALGPCFMVCATQNPIDAEGTYPLPDSQLDRFVFKLHVPYPTAAQEDRILERIHQGLDPHDVRAAGVQSLVGVEAIVQARRWVSQVHLEPSLIQYIRLLVHTTRKMPPLLYGAGPRASIHLLRSSKAWAALQGRGFVTPDDVKGVAVAVLRHRLVLRPDAEMDGVVVEDVIADLLSMVEVPR